MEIQVRLDPATKATITARILQEFPSEQFVIAEVDGKIAEFRQFGSEWHIMTAPRKPEDFKKAFPNESYNF